MNLPTIWNNSIRVNGSPTKVKPHVTLEEKEQMKLVVSRYFLTKRCTKRTEFLKDRDVLFLETLWYTGGRVSDICGMTVDMIDHRRKILNLVVAKNNSVLELPLDADIILEWDNFCRRWDITDRLFKMSRENAWYVVKKYSNAIGITAHPHMFRHGLAVHLMEKRVPLPYIQARLGHKDITTTMRFYAKITPEMGRDVLGYINEQRR